jgi:CheY-like chemotaxis protein
MGKILVPDRLLEAFRADGRFAGRESQSAASIGDAQKMLSDAAFDEVYLGGRSGSADRATLAAAPPAFGDYSRPVVLLSCDGFILWASDLARNEGFSDEALAGAPLATLFDEGSRAALLLSLDKCSTTRTVVRQIVFRNEVAFELNLVPAGTSGRPLVAAVIGQRDLAGTLSGRMARLAAIGPHLFPEDAEAVVRLPQRDRVQLIKDLIDKTVREVFEFDDFIVRTLDQKTGTLEAIIARSGTGANLPKRVLQVGVERQSVAGYVAATGKPYLVEDAGTDPHWIADLVEAQSAVIVPLKIGEKIIGTFAIEKKEKFAYDRYDLILASLFAGYVTAALNVANLVGLGQRVLMEKVAESVVDEVAAPSQSILDSVEELRRYNIGDSIAVTSRLESIRGSVAAIRDSIVKGAKKIGATVTAPVVPADELLAGKRVLIADDEPSILQSLGDILRGSGCKVDIAHDGLEAVQMATGEQFDLVISDIKMPNMSGYEVYASIKSKFPDTGVILMTAYGYDPTHSIVRARQEGLEAVLYKPFRAETLKKSLRQALEKKAAKQ